MHAIWSYNVKENFMDNGAKRGMLMFIILTIDGFYESVDSLIHKTNSTANTLKNLIDESEPDDEFKETLEDCKKRVENYLKMFEFVKKRYEWFL